MHSVLQSCDTCFLAGSARLLQLNVGISSRSVHRIQENLMRYGSVRKPHYRTLGRAKKLSKADEEALFEYLLHEGWRQQDEIKYWLWHERS